MTSNPLTPTTLPPNLQDRIDRLAELSAMHLLHTRESFFASVAGGTNDVKAWNELRQQLQERITRVIEEAKA